MQRITAPEHPEARAARLASEARKSAPSANTVPALRDQVAKLAEAVEILLNKQ